MINWEKKFPDPACMTRFEAQQLLDAEYGYDQARFGRNYFSGAIPQAYTDRLEQLFSPLMFDHALQLMIWEELKAIRDLLERTDARARGAL